MNKKAQFFLIATFIVISLFLSLTFIYNSVISSNTNSNVESLAKNIKFEGVNIINNGYKFDSGYSEIRDNLRNFTNFSSFSYKSYNFTIINIGPNVGEVNVYSYQKGKEIIVDTGYQIAIDRKNISLDLNSLKFNFNLSRGYNFFVIVINENGNERYVSSE